MMNTQDYIQNLDKATVHTLSEIVSYQPDKVASLSLVQHELFTVTLMAMDRGTGVGPHICEGDAMVVALDGEGDVLIGDTHHPSTRANVSSCLPASVTRYAERQSHLR